MRRPEKPLWLKTSRAIHGNRKCAVMLARRRMLYLQSKVAQYTNTRKGHHQYYLRMHRKFYRN